jgi:predicted molibdopterin-dependent oxidoreductase YjgC
MNIIIDGKEVEINKGDKNIVDVAARAKIGIPAPCYKAGRKDGCCNACVIEIDGENKFACATKPEVGMNIIVNREDLIQLRKERIKEYQENKKQGCGCECSTNTGCC